MVSTSANARQRGRGRPRLASRQLLEEAAFELFLEQGYAHTSVDDIALRSGVSRNTFFNYFQSKSDVFWVEIDHALASLQRHLADTPTDVAVADALAEAFSKCAQELSQSQAPWILSNFETIGRPAEVLESAMQRLTQQATVIRTFVSERQNSSDRALLPQLIANTHLAAAVSAALAWGQAGVNRRPLSTYLAEALAPLRHSFAPVTAGLTDYTPHER